MKYYKDSELTAVDIDCTIDGKQYTAKVDLKGVSNIQEVYSEILNVLGLRGKYNKNDIRIDDVFGDIINDAGFPLDTYVEYGEGTTEDQLIGFINSGVFNLPKYKF